MAPELLARYRVLQQECDFALWRAREANIEVRRKYAECVRGAGVAPGDEELAALQQLERDAETKYRELRAFLREEVAHFDDRVAPPEQVSNLRSANA